MGDYPPLIITVWVNTNGIANILSQSKLIHLKKVAIEYNSKKDEYTAESTTTKELFTFSKSTKGLYIMRGEMQSCVFSINMVRDNITAPPPREVKRSTEARIFQQTIGNITNNQLRKP